MGNIVKNPRIWIALYPDLGHHRTDCDLCIWLADERYAGFLGHGDVWTGRPDRGLYRLDERYRGWNQGRRYGAGLGWAAACIALLPAVLCPLINPAVRRLGWVKDGT